MAENTLQDPPMQLKAIQPFMKVASDVERLDPVVSYWIRLYSTETALNIDKDSPECKAYLGKLIMWLETFKQSHKDNEAISNQTVGQAHMENFVIALFNKADSLDRNGTANKTTIRMFYMASIMFEAMGVFGPLSEDIGKLAKYAKFKAAYIQKCLKMGQTPKPGPIESSDLEDPSQNVNSSEADEQRGFDEPPRTKSPAKQDPFILTPSTAPLSPSIGNQSQQTYRSTSDQSSYSNEPLPAASHGGNPGAAETSNSRAQSTIASTKFHAINGAPLTAEDILKSEKFCKFANSALQYDDIPTAVQNLEKALKLLTTGQNPG